MNMLLLIVLFAVLGYFMAFPQGTNANQPEDEDLRKKYKFNIPAQQEKAYAINRLMVYPCKGIPGIEVDAVKVSKFGIKYDREWSVLYKNEKMSPVYLSPEIKFALLRQRIERDLVSKQKYLVIYLCEEAKQEAEKLPTKELRVLIKKVVEGEIVQTPKFQGVSEGPEADAWFTAFLEKPVFMLRSAPNFKKAVPQQPLYQALDEDKTQGFISKATLHIVNEASVRDLRERVLKKYENNPEEREKMRVEADPFRPNIVIDTLVPYSEDTMQEARIANTMLRLVGYCSRCKAVNCNFTTLDYNPEQEPVSTLAEYRKNEWGTLFGTYHQIEILKSQQQFRRLLRNYPLPRDRKFDSDFSIIKKGDELKVRVAEQRIGFGKAN